MVPPRPPPPNYMAIGDEGSPMMHDERRTVDLMHKPNGEPNVYNATPRIIKKEPRVPKAEPAASAAKAPAPSVEPVEFDPASSLKAQMRPYDASGDAGLSPHAEYSLEILREFFKKRPIQSLKDTFYSMDANCSGKLDEQEFKEALKHLYIDVTAKDSAAIFRAVDFDKSGELNFDEFYRSFRTDAFKRADFFWGKARPFAAPDRANRAQLAHELGVKVDKASTAEIMATIQAKVDRKGIQLMYRVFDEKRDGLRNTKAFAKSMKRVGIELTDAEADDVIRAIHLQAGPNPNPDPDPDPDPDPNPNRDHPPAGGYPDPSRVARVLRRLCKGVQVRRLLAPSGRRAERAELHEPQPAELRGQRARRRRAGLRRVPGGRGRLPCGGALHHRRDAPRRVSAPRAAPWQASRRAAPQLGWGGCGEGARTRLLDLGRSTAAAADRRRAPAAELGPRSARDRELGSSSARDRNLAADLAGHREQQSLAPAAAVAGGVAAAPLAAGGQPGEWAERIASETR